MSGLLSSITGATPTSQKDRRIAFLLEVDGAVVEEVTLSLRPEELTRTDTSRTTVHHTLGGAWADSFGPGLPTIQISGTTGWRGGQDGDGEARWKRLRDGTFNAWHNRRREAIQQGRDPANIRLIFADALNGFAVEVVPMALTLRRSRSRPLLFAYAMTLQVVSENADQLRFLQGGARNDAAGGVGGFFAAVTGAIARIRGAIQGVTGWVQANLVAPVRAFLGMAQGVFSGVLGIVRDTRNLVGSVLTIPALVAQAGTSLFRTIAAVASLPAQIKADVMGVAGAFVSVLCFLLRARATRLAYADYTGFYGASGCSSLSGGRPVSPLAGTNALATLPSVPSVPGLAVSSTGAAGLRTLAGSDPVLRPMNDNQIATALAQVNGGVSYAASAA